MAVVPRGVRCVSGCGYAKRVRAFCKTVCILTVSGVGCTPFFCFLFPYLSVPLRFRTRSLHTHYSKHLYAYIPLPDGCRNYKLRHSACTLCFKACGFVINTFFTDRSTGVIPCCPSENQTPASFCYVFLAKFLGWYVTGRQFCLPVITFMQRYLPLHLRHKCRTLR